MSRCWLLARLKKNISFCAIQSIFILHTAFSTQHTSIHWVCCVCYDNSRSSFTRTYIYDGWLTVYEHQTLEMHWYFGKYFWFSSFFPYYPHWTMNDCTQRYRPPKIVTMLYTMMRNSTVVFGWIGVDFWYK